MAGCATELPAECVGHQGNLVHVALKYLVNKQYLNPNFDNSESGAYLTQLKIVSDIDEPERGQARKIHSNVLLPLLDSEVSELMFMLSMFQSSMFEFYYLQIVIFCFLTF